MEVIASTQRRGRRRGSDVMVEIDGFIIGTLDTSVSQAPRHTFFAMLVSQIIQELCQQI